MSMAISDVKSVNVVVYVITLPFSVFHCFGAYFIILVVKVLFYPVWFVLQKYLDKWKSDT